MNKVFNVNLGGMVFTIDEPAFIKLNNYINRLKAHFAGTDGANEIIADIEARMAELIRQQQSSNEEVVNEAMADQVINVMGDANQMEGAEQAEEKSGEAGSSRDRKLRRNLSDKVLGGVCSGLADYFDVDTSLVRIVFLFAFFIFGSGILLYVVLWIVMQPAEETEAQANNLRQSKKLFRDSDDRVLGGVCSGLAHYLGIDPVWVRLFFAVALFVFGVGFWIYIALWIAVPITKNAAQKLQMKGESVDVSNIEREVKSAFHAAKQNAPHLKKEMKDIVKRGANTFGEIISVLFKAFGKIIAFCLMIAALGITAVFVIFYFRYGRVGLYHDLINMFIDDGFMHLALKTGFILAIFVPVLMLLIAALRLLFNLRFKRGLIFGTLGVLSSIGWILLLVAGCEYYFSIENKSGITHTIAVKRQDTLYLVANQFDFANEDSSETSSISFPGYFSSGNGETHFGKVSVLTEKGIWNAFQKLKISKTPGDSAYSYLEIKKTSRGSDKPDAIKNASQIQYEVKVTDSLLSFDEGLFIPRSAKWKFPQVKMNLFIPAGTIVIIDKKVRRMINRNLLFSDEKYIEGKTFKMNAEGLVCLDCKTTPTDEDDDNDLDELRKINITIGDETDKDEADSTNHHLVRKTRKVIIRDGHRIEIEEKQVGPIHIKKVKKLD
ncbi:MAG: PspC domain-containing protein [Bacteroidia bacterium]